MRSESAGHGVTRRQVLRATGGTLAVGLLGVGPVSAQEGCQGAAFETAPDDLPEINLRGESVAASNVPDASKLIVYVHGFDTSPEDGRRLAATLDVALSEDAAPVVAAPWRATHDMEASGQEEGGEKFAQAETNADEDGQKLAAWLQENAQDRTVRLVGYSLGTRVALSAVDALDSEAVDLASVSLLGSAVPGSMVCGDSGYDLTAARAVFSYRSENDRVLCEAFVGYLNFFAEANPPALGCRGPGCADIPENFVDRNVTDTIDNHCAYGFSEVGVVPQVESDFTTPLSEVERESGDSEQEGNGEQDEQGTNTPGGGDETPETQETDTDTDGSEESEQPGGSDPTTTESDAQDMADSTATPATGDNSPGFGIGGALASLGSLGYLLGRRVSDDDSG